MKKYILLVMLASITQWGCEFLGGAAVGGLATGAGYEYNAKRQMDRLDDDLRDEKISRRSTKIAGSRSSAARSFINASVGRGG
jgi:hypothetical protein